MLGGTPIEKELCASMHGPIVQVEGSVAFAYQSPLPDFVDESVESLFAISRTNTLQGFQRALSNIALNFNFFFADRKGNIAWWHVGKFALRPEGIDPRFPLSGTGEQEWQGFVPFGQLPKVLNPGQGFLVNWNNRPASDWPYTLAGTQGPVQRVVALADYMTNYDAGSFTLDSLSEEYGTAEMSAWLRPVVEQSWMPQGAGTVPSTEFKNRGSYNQLTTWDRKGTKAINILPPGQSGNPFSPHFDDQLELYSNYVYKPMLLGPANIAADAVSVRVLEPDFTHWAEDDT